MFHFNRTNSSDFAYSRVVTFSLHPPIVPSVRSERTLRLWKIKTFSCKAKLSKSFDFLHNYSQYGDNWGNLNIIGLKWYLIPFLGGQKGQKMIFRPFLEVCKHKFGHNSVNIGRRDLRLLFLERQLNFALFADVFCGLHFHNLSQNLRDFLFLVCLCEIFCWLSTFFV